MKCRSIPEQSRRCTAHHIMEATNPKLKAPGISTVSTTTSDENTPFVSLNVPSSMQAPESSIWIGIEWHNLPSTTLTGIPPSPTSSGMPFQLLTLIRMSINTMAYQPTAKLLKLILPKF